MGLWKYGVMNVLSIVRRAPRDRARSASFRRSEMIIEGFVGVSTKSIRVDGLNAASTWFRHEVST
jgi:hypothetical protein